jgi:hypothetical protein
VGLGRESRAPTWAATRSVNRRLSIPIGRSHVDPDGTKPALGSLCRTLAYSFSPLPLPHRSESLVSESKKATALPQTPSSTRATIKGWTCRCRAAPRQGPSSPVNPQRRPQEHRRPLLPARRCRLTVGGGVALYLHGTLGSSGGHGGP